MSKKNEIVINLDTMEFLYKRWYDSDDLDKANVYLDIIEAIIKYLCGGDDIKAQTLRRKWSNDSKRQQ